MSNYKDFVSDFPNRCSDLLRRFYKPAKYSDREVTLLLTIATSGLVVPFERLKPNKEGDLSPFFSDPDRHNSASKTLSELMSTKFLGSRLAGSTSTWIYFNRKVEHDDMPDQWEDLRLPQQKISNQKTCGSVLKLLRNALAHGNIFSTGIKINQLIFLSRLDWNEEKTECMEDLKHSREQGRFGVLAVSPDDFHQFLLNWFDFLSEVRMPRGIEENIHFES